MTSGTGSINLHVRECVARVVISNPGRRNAVSSAMWVELARVFEQFSGDLSLRCVTVRGDAGHFAGGADIEEFPALRFTRAAAIAYHEDVIAPALRAIGACLHPTVAVIEGACVGGGLEIAGRCDLRIASSSARFGVPINRLGFPMAPEELRGLITLAGPAVALEMLLEARVFDAQDAFHKGLVTRVVSDAELERECETTISNLVAGAPLAHRMNKAMVARLTPPTPLLGEDELEQAFSYVLTRDHREGVDAFLAGRSPDFTGT